MTGEPSIDELEAKASAFRRQKRWREARECYEEMVDLGLTPADKAKMLANIMQMYEKEGDVDKAISAGTRALDIIQTYRIYETFEGAHLRGVVRGYLGRLRREPFPWHLPITFLSAYFIGASLGAAIGSRITYQGLTIRGFVLTDLRYGGAGLGALLGWLLLTRLLSRMGVVLPAIGGFLNFAVLCYILTEKSFSLGIIVLGMLFFPIVLGIGIVLQRRE